MRSLACWIQQVETGQKVAPAAEDRAGRLFLPTHRTGHPVRVVAHHPKAIVERGMTTRGRHRLAGGNTGGSRLTLNYCIDERGAVGEPGQRLPENRRSGQSGPRGQRIAAGFVSFGRMPVSPGRQHRPGRGIPDTPGLPTGHRQPASSLRIAVFTAARRRRTESETPPAFPACHVHMHCQGAATS